MKEETLKSGIVVVSEGADERALRTQAIRMILESHSIAKFYSVKEACEAADIVAAYIKGEK